MHQLSNEEVGHMFPEFQQPVIAYRRGAPFYKYGKIIEMIEGVEVWMFVEAGPDRILITLNDPDDIYRANKLAGLQLNEGNALAYLKFFQNSVRTESGMFNNVLEATVDLALLKHDFSLRDMAMKMAVKPGVPEEYHFEGFMECGFRLFRAKMVLKQDGFVDRVSRSETLGELVVGVV